MQFLLQRKEKKMKYKVIKCKPWIKDVQETIDKWAKDGWEVVSHACNTGTAGCVIVFKKK